MNRFRGKIAKNAVSNLVRGGATAIVAFALPHFLAHSLDPARFAAWSLILQIAAYASILDFGLQTAVARFIAQALELNHFDRVRKLIETALAMLSLAALLALAAVGVIVLCAGSLFHGIPPGLLSEFQVAALVMAAGAALLLPLSTFTGVLIGMHRNELPALAIGGSRLLGGGAAIVAAHYTHSLVLIASCVAAPNLAGGLLQAVFVSRHLPGVANLRVWMDRAAALGFLRYCAGLTIWSFGMLLISGLDVTIVAHFQFEAAGYYALASTLMALFASSNSSVLSALLAPFAAMQANGQFDRMRDIVIRSTRISALFSFICASVLIAYGGSLLRLWVGPYYAYRAYPILVVLTLAQALRLMGNGYSIALLATGHQNRSIGPAVVEAVTNLAASLWAVTRFGAIGVAFGSLFAVFVGMPIAFIFVVRPSESLTVTRTDLALRGMLRGLLPCLPLLACSVFVALRHPMPAQSLFLWALAIAFGLGIFRSLEHTFQALRSDYGSPDPQS
jgi:O-antigen/teichoic acid export membrane protein